MNVQKAAESSSSIDVLCCYVTVSERQIFTGTSVRGTSKVKHQGCYYVQYAAWSKLLYTSGQQDSRIIINKGQC